MLDILRMKADCRPPISRRSSSKPVKRASRSLLMATAPVSGVENHSKKSSNSPLKEKENKSNLDILEEFKLSKELEIKNLQDILLSNLNLVEQQERLLVIREKEIVHLKRENETLRCRLERMDRRVSLMKHPPVTPSPLSANKREDTNRAIKRKGSFEPHSLAKKFAPFARHEYERDQLKTEVKQTPSKQTPKKHSHLSGLKRRSFKRRLSDHLDVSPSDAERSEAHTDTRGVRNRQLSSHHRETHERSNHNDVLSSLTPNHRQASAKKLNSGDTLFTSRRLRRRIRIPKDENVLKTNIEYYVPQEPIALEISPKKPDKDHVVVPSYRIKHFSPYYVIDGRENFEDEVYTERHKKPENEEKKRKRWDLQKQREEEQRRKLLCSQRYHKHKIVRSNSSKTEKNINMEFTSLVPDPTEIEYIEVCDELPVSVFGYPLPSTQSEEFVLPWFDMEKRDREEQKKTCGRKR